jgi:hypothetical protein
MTHPMQTPARELTQEELEDRAKECFKIHQRVVEAIKDGKAALWALAEALHEFDEARGWQALGFETLGEWLADPEIGMRQSTYHNAIRRWRKLSPKVEPKRLVGLDPSKVTIVMGAIARNETPLDEVLDDVETLGARDLREKYIGEQSSVRTEPVTTEEGQERVRNLNEVALGEDDEPPFEDEEPAEQLAQNGDVPTSGQVVVGSEEVAVPRWLVEAIIGKFGINRRMNHEWIETLKACLETTADVG